MSATAWSAIDVRPVTARAAFQSPRALTALSAWAVCRSSARFAGTAPMRPCARRTPRTSAQLTWFAREIDRSRCAKPKARRRDGGVGSGRGRLSQTTRAAPERGGGEAHEREDEQTDEEPPAAMRFPFHDGLAPIPLFRRRRQSSARRGDGGIREPHDGLPVLSGARSEPPSLE